MGSNHVSPIGRIAYPNIATARKRNDTAKPRFSVTLVFSESVDLTEMKKQIAAVVREKYPDGPPKNFRSPLRSGAEREDTEGFTDTDTFAEFWKYEERGIVPVIDAKKNEMIASDVYAGMMGRVSFNIFCYDRDGNRGVSLGLEAVQKSADGTPIGYTPVDPQEAFGALEAADAKAVDDFF